MLSSMNNKRINEVVPQWRGDESAQRKRFLKSEEESLAKTFGPDWRRAVRDRREE